MRQTMRIIPSVILSSALLIASSSCVETLVMDPGEDNLPVVVSCVLRSAPNSDGMIRIYDQQLHLFYAKGKSQKESVPITDAKVYILGGHSSRDTVIKFSHAEGTLWKGAGPIMANHGYALIVEIPGHETISASTITPHPFLAVSGYGTMAILKNDDHEQSDAPNTRYPHKIWIYAHKGIHDDNETDKDAFKYLYTDCAYADDFNTTGEKYSDMDLSGKVGERYSDMWNVLKKRQDLLPDVPQHRGFVRIDLPGYYSNGKSVEERKNGFFSQIWDDFMMIPGPLECPANTIGGMPRTEHFDILSVSEEYDKYLRDVYRKDSKLHHDLTSAYSTDNAYSNIKNGLGIFGSYIFHSTGVYH